ncbi:MAG: hypothetical protein PQJ44_05290 [Sphaerochaetaceae bacterium]|nr:hypothetical protein [Sphaerochaetaceae bacterium]
MNKVTNIGFFVRSLINITFSIETIFYGLFIVLVVISTYYAIKKFNSIKLIFSVSSLILAIFILMLNREDASGNIRYLNVFVLDAILVILGVVLYDRYNFLNKGKRNLSYIISLLLILFMLLPYFYTSNFLVKSELLTSIGLILCIYFIGASIKGEKFKLLRKRVKNVISDNFQYSVKLLYINKETKYTLIFVIAILISSICAVHILSTALLMFILQASIFLFNETCSEDFILLNFDKKNCLVNYEYCLNIENYYLTNISKSKIILARFKKLNMKFYLIDFESFYRVVNLDME